MLYTTGASKFAHQHAGEIFNGELGTSHLPVQMKSIIMTEMWHWGEVSTPVHNTKKGRETKKF